MRVRARKARPRAISRIPWGRSPVDHPTATGLRRLPANSPSVHRRRHMSFLLTVEKCLSKVLSMLTRPKQPSRPKPVLLALATTFALGIVAGACKDPNPTFVFDASSDGAKDAVTDGTGSTDTSGVGGGGAG